MTIPFQDLTYQNKIIEKEVYKEFKKIFKTQRFILGENLEKFEKKFAEYNEIKFSLGVANGSEALEIILRALDIPPKSEVLLPANTFIATAQAVIRAGLIPKLVDVDKRTLISEAEHFEDKITHKTSVLLPVHLYGQMPDMDRIKHLADRNNLFVVEDAAQSQGSLCRGRKMGYYSIASASSFYPGKNLGAWGDAGGIVTNDESLFNKMKKIRNYGSDARYKHEEYGFNSRMDEMQAAVLLQKIKYLNKWNNSRNKLAEAYIEVLNALTYLEVPLKRDNFFNNYHLFVIKVERRSQLVKFLNEKLINTLIHYPVPIYKHKAFENIFLNNENIFPNTENSTNLILSLPLYPGLSMKKLTYVANSIKDFFEED